MTKHTKGPWTIKYWPHTNIPDEPKFVLIKDANYTFCKINIDSPKLLANARLIAAAPELLEALKLLKSEAWGTSVQQLMYQGNEAVLKANKAIAKAEGNES